VIHISAWGEGKAFDRVAVVLFDEDDLLGEEDGFSDGEVFGAS
jgi:hypothetical protein